LVRPRVPRSRHLGNCDVDLRNTHWRWVGVQEERNHLSGIRLKESKVPEERKLRLKLRVVHDATEFFRLGMDWDARIGPFVKLA
jgi:hypothetical protein